MNKKASCTAPSTEGVASSYGVQKCAPFPVTRQQEGDRLTNSLWSQYVENGDYSVFDFNIADCSQCGAKQVECQILESEDKSKPTINICVRCSGGDV